MACAGAVRRSRALVPRQARPRALEQQLALAEVARERGGVIKPDETLVFVVDLVAVR